MRRILVVDDEPKILRLVRDRLRDDGHEVQTCGSAETAKPLLAGEIFDVLVTDLRLPESDGIELLQFARETTPAIQVIVITAYGTVDTAVEAMQSGAVDFIQKPFDMDALSARVRHALESTEMREELRRRSPHGSGRAACRKLTGSSTAMSRVRRLISYVAPSPTTVLILGESGTGKEVAAESIHAASAVSDRPLVRVNCMAIPSELMESELFGHVRGAFTGANASRKGWFELASGGTLFLDEIGDLPLPLQGKLLRVLEDGRITRVGSRSETSVDLRLVAATNRDPQALVATGRFREDLYYRLNVFPISLPPLRERLRDLPELVDSVRASIVERLERPTGGVSDEALGVLSRYDFPGNVRELRNILERAFILAGNDDVQPHHLPEELFVRPSGGAARGVAGASFHEQIESTKASILLETLRAVNWVKKDAAARLGLTPRAFSHYVAKFDLDSHRCGQAASG